MNKICLADSNEINAIWKLDRVLRRKDGIIIKVGEPKIYKSKSHGIILVQNYKQG